jgi:hypothetical protein
MQGVRTEIEHRQGRRRGVRHLTARHRDHSGDHPEPETGRVPIPPTMALSYRNIKKLCGPRSFPRMVRRPIDTKLLP